MGAFIPVDTLDSDAQFDAYVAKPEGEAKAAIIVIQEIFGVNEGIRRKCDGWAKAGYVAYAPDLFWRIDPHIELDPDVPDEMDQALALMPKFNQDQGIRDLEATIKAARVAAGGGKVGLVGYCLGGRLAFMAACRTDGDAFVGYYGVASMDCWVNNTRSANRPCFMSRQQIISSRPMCRKRCMRD